MDSIKPGRYRHYKGKDYQVIGTGRNSETLEEMVVYQALYKSEDFGDKVLWIRPKELFLKPVMIDGKEAKRFKYIS
ncbi:MAG: DUF1653 domain-containing protein [bacterium]